MRREAQKNNIFSCFKNVEDDEEKEGNERFFSSKFYIISRTGRFWKVFQFMVTILGLLSSYFYCTIMCNRYIVSDDHHAMATKWVIGFEAIFLVHCGL